MRVAVLGAGLQGTCIAMDLADGGMDVDLYDRNSECMTQASLRNEGKVHLGYVYANDASMRSAATMVEGAATFGPLLAHWLGSPITRLRTSSEFNYAVHRDSLLSHSDFENHLFRNHELAVERIRAGDYLGCDISLPPERLTQRALAADYDSDAVKAVYRTAEIGIDPTALASLIRDRVASDSRIHAVFDTEVHGVEIGTRRIGVRSTNSGDQVIAEYDQVINALWDGRLVVDETAGLMPDGPWLFRVKHFLRVQTTTTKVPSTTIVLGPFGDIVDYGNGAFYLSWYPSGLQGSSPDLQLPNSLRSLPDKDAARMRKGIIEGLASVVPNVAKMQNADLMSAELAGGVIFAWGETDIDDVASGLHQRSAIGPISVGNYHTVDTGKLTTAPMSARMVADRVRGDR